MLLCTRTIRRQNLGEPRFVSSSTVAKDSRPCMARTLVKCITKTDIIKDFILPPIFVFQGETSIIRMTAQSAGLTAFIILLRPCSSNLIRRPCSCSSNKLHAEITRILREVFTRAPIAQNKSILTFFLLTFIPAFGIPPDTSG